MRFRLAFGVYAVFIACAAPFFPNSFFIGHDGEYFSALAKLTFQSSRFSDGVPINPIQAMGGISFLLNHWLCVPSLLHVFFEGSMLRYSVPLVVVALQVFAANWWWLRGLGFSAASCSLGTWLLCLSLFPPFLPAQINHMQLIGPSIAETSARLMAASAAFLFLGRASRNLNLALVGVALAGIFLSVGSDPLFTLVLSPFLVLPMVPHLLMARGNELRWKLGLVAGILGGALALRLPEFYRGAVGATARTIFNDRIGILRDPDQASVVYGTRAGFPGFVLYTWVFIAALVGAFLARKDLEPRLRRTTGGFWLSVLIFFGLMHSFLRASSWLLPQPSYFEYSLYSLYFALLAFLVGKLIPRHETRAAWAVVIAAVLWGFLQEKEGRPMLESTGIAAALKNDIGYADGRDFRGSIIFTEITPRRSGEFIPLSYGWIIPALTKFQIPTLAQYSHHIDPLWHVVARRFLLDPQTRLDRNRTLPEPRDMRLLISFGARYLMGLCQDLDALAPDYVRKLAQERVVCLYGLRGEVNVGQYSPVRTLIAKDVKEALGLMGEASYDPRKTAVLTEDWVEERLVPANKVSLRFGADGFVLEAESDGESLLALPVLYSHAWRLIPEEGSGCLLRVNLVQSGVRFRGKLRARLEHHFGPFTNPTARGLDLREMERLGIRSALN